MISFKKFINEEAEDEDLKINYPGGVYISAAVSEITQNALIKYQEEFLKGEDINEELHCTLIYSKKPHVDLIEPGALKAIGIFSQFSLFGPEKNTLVIELQSADLKQRNEVLTDEYGFISDYDEYKPHITLSYDFKGDINSLPDIDFEMTFENETVEPLNTNWNGDGDEDEEESGTFVGKEMAKSKAKEKEEKADKKKEEKEPKEKEEE